MGLIKTYFCSDKFENDFPSDFINARGEKYIEVRLCYATVNNYLVGDLMLHSDFIIRDTYLDHFVNMVNVINNSGRPDKYAYPEIGKKTFKIWFTDLKGNVVVPDAFVLKLLLVYQG